MLSEKTIAVQRVALVTEARSWIGTPWRHRGRHKGVGVDCAMLLAEVYRAAGLIERVDPAPYPRDWFLHRDEERFLAEVERIARRLPDGVPPLPADIALYRFGRCVSHGAIVIRPEPLKILHAHVQAGMVTLSEGDAPWLAKPGRFAGFWRLAAWWRD